MSIQGSNIIDISFFQNLTEAVDNVQTCAELQALVAEATGVLDDVKAAIALELAKVQPMLALLIVPGANLAQIVTYLKTLVDSLITPLVKPYVTYAAQLTATTVAIAELASAIQRAADRIGNCSVSINPL